MRTGTLGTRGRGRRRWFVPPATAVVETRGNRRSGYLTFARLGVRHRGGGGGGAGGEGEADARGTGGSWEEDDELSE